MQTFAQLYQTLEQTASPDAQVAALVVYFRTVPAEDAAWGLHLLMGYRPKRLVTTAHMRAWLADCIDLPPWLLDACYAQVGDWAECVALLTAPATVVQEPLPLHHWMTVRLPSLLNQPEPQQRQIITTWWQQLERASCFLLNKLLNGGLRLKISQALLGQALAQYTGQESALIAQRLAADWQPTGQSFKGLAAPPDIALSRAQPYPFFLASVLDVEPETLGDPDDWLVEWQWDGIRAQLLCRDGNPQLWSRGEERLSDCFPVILSGAQSLSDPCVLDGVILSEGGRKPRVSRSAIPAVYMACDLLELQGHDWRGRPLGQRRAALAALLQNAPATLRLSPVLEVNDWPGLACHREIARQRGATGLMLKRRDAGYGSGGRSGDWWKWQADPYTINAVMIYAQAGQGRRTDFQYTLAVWEGTQLVPLTKVWANLSEAEQQRLNRWIRDHTQERFGPVRSVEPVQVFALAFEGLTLSRRHKSGIALSAPRMVRWQEHKPPTEADTLATVKALLPETAIGLWATGPVCASE